MDKELNLAREIILNYYNFNTIISIKKITKGLNSKNLIVHCCTHTLILKIVTKENRLTTFDINTEEQKLKILCEIKSLSHMEQIIIPILNKHGNYITERDNCYYTVTPFIQGETVKDMSIDQINSLAKTISIFHKSSLNFLNKIDSDNKREKLLLKFIEDGTNSEKHNGYLNLFKTLEKYESGEKTIFHKENDLVFIHGDLDYTNYLFRKDSLVALFDFDNLRIGSKAEEVIRTCIGFGIGFSENKYFFKIDEMRSFVNTYKKFNSLDLNKDNFLYFSTKDLLIELSIWTHHLKNNPTSKECLASFEKIKDKIDFFQNNANVILEKLGL